VKQLETLDLKSALRTTLVQKQELVRDYQTFAEQINNSEVSKMYRHFAEAEALHATQIKQTLDQLH
jgi:rubrerythrin